MIKLIAGIAVDNTVYHFDKIFDYVVPDALSVLPPHPVNTPATIVTASKVLNTFLFMSFPP